MDYSLNEKEFVKDCVKNVIDEKYLSATHEMKKKLTIALMKVETLQEQVNLQEKNIENMRKCHECHLKLIEKQDAQTQYEDLTLTQSTSESSTNLISVQTSDATKKQSSDRHEEPSRDGRERGPKEQLQSVGDEKIETPVKSHIDEQKEQKPTPKLNFSSGQSTSKSTPQHSNRTKDPQTYHIVLPNPRSTSKITSDVKKQASQPSTSKSTQPSTSKQTQQVEAKKSDPQLIDLTLDD